MPLPVFGAAGAGVAATTGSSINVAYPAGITAGDTLIVHVLDWNGTSGPTTPSGWTLITTIDTATPGRAAAFWKTADGTESGTLSVTLSGSGSGHYGRMYRFSGAAAAVDNVGSSTGNSTTVADQGVTTSGPNRLAVNLVTINDNSSPGAFSGMSGGTWAEAVAEYSTATGNDACLQLQTADMASAGTINGGTLTVATATSPATNDYSVIGFSLPPGAVPIGQALETDSALSITPVLTPSGLSGTIGLTTETDSAFSITPSLTAAADLAIYAAVDFGIGYEELTDRIRAVSVRRGRPFNLDRVEAGTANATFKNGDGNLDPSNAAGGWYGRIHPLTPLRILRRQGGITYERFNGPIERFQPRWIPPSYQEMEVQAADSFEALANTILVSDQATFTTNLSGTNNDLVFTAVEAGGQGDDITIELVVAGVDTPLDADTNEPLTGSSILTSSSLWPSGLQLLFASVPRTPTAVTVQGSDISVSVATNGAGAAVSTAAQLKTAMEAVPEIASLVTIAHAPGSSGAGIVTAMAKTNLAGGKWTQERSGERITRILDLAGWSASLRDIDSGTYDMVAQGFSIKENVSALSHIQDIADSELGYVFMRGDNTFVYHDAQHRNVDPRSTASRATFTNDGGTGFLYQDIQLSFDKDRIVNEATVTGGLQGAVPQTVSDLYSQTGIYTASGLVTNGDIEVDTSGWIGGNSAVISRVTSQAYSGSASLQVAAPGAVPNEYTGYALGALTSGQTYVGSAWVKAPVGARLYMNLLENVAARVDFIGTGAWQQVTTPTNTGTGVSANLYLATDTTGPAQAVTFWVDDAYVGAPGGGTSTVTVPADGYGKRAVSRNTLLANDTDCLAQARAIVAAFAYPQQRIETLVSFEPAGSSADAWVASVLGLELGDLITVTTLPPAATTLTTTSYGMFVEEITDELTVGHPWVVSLRLTPASQSVAAPPPPPAEGALLNNIGGAFILDSATDGKLG